MNNTVIAFLTKDRIELTKQTLPPLLQRDEFDLLWIDGSTDPDAVMYAAANGTDGHATVHLNVRGGADAAIVYALTQMLKPYQQEKTTRQLSQRLFVNTEYKYVGLVENDVLLPDDWFDRTMELFKRGRDDGLNVGAVSARCYADRVLFPRDGYAVFHNLGAGMIIFTREAADLVLQNYRNAFSLDNRTVFNQLSDIDIGQYWAFRGENHWLTADWGFETTLARAGLASLALTPSPVEMIGQQPSLAEQGLQLVSGCAIPQLANAASFPTFKKRLSDVYNNNSAIAPWFGGRHLSRDGTWTIFPHQIPELGGTYAGDWGLKWCQGFGPFAWRATAADAILTIPVSGTCNVLVGGGPTGAKVEVSDAFSGNCIEVELQPEGLTTNVLALSVPAGVSYRYITLTAKSPGVTFYGLTTRDPQPRRHVRFDHSVLPPPIAS